MGNKWNPGLIEAGRRRAAVAPELPQHAMRVCTTTKAVQCLLHMPQIEFALGIEESTARIRNLGIDWGMCSKLGLAKRVLAHYRIPKTSRQDSKMLGNMMHLLMFRPTWYHAGDGGLALATIDAGTGSLRGFWNISRAKHSKARLPAAGVDEQRLARNTGFECCLHSKGGA